MSPKRNSIRTDVWRSPEQMDAAVGNLAPTDRKDMRYDRSSHSFAGLWTSTPETPIGGVRIGVHRGRSRAGFRRNPDNRSGSLRHERMQ